MQYSPKLKRAAEQIRKILKDNDIAGFVALHTPGNAEYINELTPSYSALKWTPQTNRMDVLGKVIHYGGDKTKRDKRLADTANMLTLLAEVSGNQILGIMELSDLVQKTWDIEHGPSSHSSDQQQNN